MTFPDLCRLVHPFLSGRCKSKAEVFDLLILNCISPKKEGLREEISHLKDRQKRNLFEGKSSLSKTAEKIYPYLDTSPLIEIMEGEITDYSADDFVETFGYYVPGMGKENFAEKFADLLRKIILDSSAMFRSAQLEGTAALRSSLFQEDGGRCPCCGRPLSLDSSSENAIVAIGLDGSSPSQSSKAIGLCRRCAELHRNGELPKDATSLKEKAERLSAMRSQTCDISFDERLMGAVESLLKNAKSQKAKLSMKSLKISQKVDQDEEFALYNKIRSNVVLYFPMLYEMFSSLDGDKQRSYEVLSCSIRIACIKAEEKSASKEEVFNYLADEISNIAGCEKSIAEIIVSYFVQSCEVFHEIPE